MQNSSFLIQNSSILISCCQAPAECTWGWTFAITLIVASVLYLSAGIGFAVKTQGAAPSIGAHPHVAIWQNFGGLVTDGIIFAKARATGKPEEAVMLYTNDDFN